MNQQTKVAFPDDHYKWLDAVSAEAVKRFDLKVNPNDVAAAHGDKCYGFKFKWKKNGVPFERGVFIYLLTSSHPFYGSQVRQTRNGWVDPGQWVIDYYHANDGLAKIFDQIEAELFLEKK
jgi:hypothetical protein